MKKRIISTVLLFCIFLSMLSVMAMADLSEVLDFGTCGAQGDNLTWVLNEDGTLTISGSGDMYDYYNSTIPGYQYASKITKNRIPERSKFFARECRIATDYCYSVRYIFRLVP